MPPSLHPWLRPSWVHGLLLCALTAAAYAGSLRAGFVFDDFALVVYNQAIQELGRAGSLFGQDLWATADSGTASGYYRPLMSLSLALDWRLAGTSPALYHLHSLAWHLLAVWFLHRLLVILTQPLPALLGAALFALHPLQSEAVVWIAARNDLMGAALLLGALLLLRPLGLAPWRLGLGAVLAVGAVLSKESTLLLPLFLLLLDLAEHGRPRGWTRHAVLWGAVALHLAARGLAGVNAAAAPPQVGWVLLGRKLPELAALAGSLLVWPWPLSVGRDLGGWSLATPALLVGLAVCALLVVGSLIRRQRLALVGLGWAALAVAPSLVAVADKGLFGERYLYLSLAGLGLALAATLQALPRARLRWAGVALLVVVPWFLILHARVLDWKDDVTLWRAAARDTPCTYVYAGLGHVLNRDGARGEAAEMFLLALRGSPPQREVCPRLMDLAATLGDIQRVVEVAGEAVDLGCRDPITRGKYATYLVMSGRWERAVALAGELEHADLEGRARLVLAAWGVVEGDCARYREARADWPGDMDSQMQLLYHHGGHPELARAASAGLLCGPSPASIPAREQP